MPRSEAAASRVSPLGVTEVCAKDVVTRGVDTRTFELTGSYSSVPPPLGLWQAAYLRPGYRCRQTSLARAPPCDLYNRAPAEPRVIGTVECRPGVGLDTGMTREQWSERRMLVCVRRSLVCVYVCVTGAIRPLIGRIKGYASACPPIGRSALAHCASVGP